MNCYPVHFSSSSSSEAGRYKVLELPAELCQLVENSLLNFLEPSLSIRGGSKDDAILCTADKTYAMRSVALSNTLLMVTSVPDDSQGQSFPENSVVIRDQVNEVIELISVVPKLHKLVPMLKGLELDDDPENSMESENVVKYDDARDLVQASDAEFERGLKDRRVLVIDGCLRPISPTYLQNILETVLTLTVSLSLDPDNISVETLCDVLSESHEISRTISTQVMSWFGVLNQGVWKMDSVQVVRNIGLGLLETHQVEAVNREVFVSSWRETVGDKFEHLVNLDLLAGDYLSSVSSATEEVSLTYYPSSSLPIEPSARFGDLFAVRSRWKDTEINPFLSDIAVDSKARDHLLLKFARAITDSTGIWYTARTQAI